MKLKAYVYKVPVSEIEMDIEADIKREQVDREIGCIAPYGLSVSDVYDLEIKEKIEPAVVQEHIEKSIKKQTKHKK